MEASMKKKSLQPSPILGALEKSLHRIYISPLELSSCLLLGIQGPSEGGILSNTTGAALSCKDFSIGSVYCSGVRRGLVLY